jgi:hypothetical protein
MRERAGVTAACERTGGSFTPILIRGMQQIDE